MYYWLIFLVWTLYAFFIKKDSLHHLLIAFGLFIVSSLLETVTLHQIAEPIMRVSFLGWLIGVIVALKEYKQHQVDNI